MSKIVEEVTLGIDVGQLSLDIFGANLNDVLSIENNETAIRAFLGSFSGPVAIAVEATGVFHEMLVDIAQEFGFTVYLIDGYRVNKYREAVGVRAKTDPNDARLIHRYLVAERALLRPIVQQNQEVRLLWRLLKRRAKVVKLRAQLQLSLQGLMINDADKEVAITGLDGLIKQLTDQAKRLAKTLNWGESLARLETIPGVGELIALGLRAMYARGEFTNADRFIAFLGLDIRVRDSGKHRGRRKLSKKGDSEIRRLLFNGARSAATHRKYWGSLKAQYMARGMSEIQVSVALSRKLARIAYAILRDETVYETPV